MTNEQNALICRRLAGYEVQVSPAGKHYIVTDEGTRAMPDWESDSEETLSTVEALCRSRGYSMDAYRIDIGYRALINGIFGAGKTITSAVAQSLLHIAEKEK